MKNKLDFRDGCPAKFNSCRAGLQLSSRPLTLWSLILPRKRGMFHRRRELLIPEIRTTLIVVNGNSR